MIIVGICLACNNRNAPPKNLPFEEDTETINLSTVTQQNQTGIFHEVTRASQLPKTVVDALAGIADPKQPFNATDVVDPRLPMKRLIVAAVSDNYCIVSYWQGGIALSLKTSIFELSNGSAKRILVSTGGGLNFRDLKATLESGLLHNDLEKR
ncbi:MAG TPA: hypothetical protein VJN89_09895 [Candidatus Acidoferrum sp.]|nr:hypothetical protein [Candidatus Acidoferrum sp.]